MKKKRAKKPLPSTVTTLPDYRPYQIIIAIGVMARLIYDIELAETVYLGNYILDSITYHDWAMGILGGDEIQAPFYRAPLYPYLVAGVYKLFGASPWPIVILQNLLGVGTSLIAFAWARRLMPSSWALAAGIVTALYPTLIFYEGELMMTALTVFLYIGASYLIYLACERPNVGRLLVAGLVLGIAAITRPAILPLAGILPVALLLGEKRRGWGSLVKGTVVFMAGVLAPIAPVTAINYFVGGEAVLISTQGGVNFYMGNGAIADGITAEALGQPRPATGKYQDVIHTSSIDEAEASLGRKLSQSEVSSYWYDRALDDIAADPVRAVRLFLKKFWLNFHGQELINFRSPNYAGTYSTYMALTLWRHGLNFPSGLLFPFAICGIVLGWRQKKELSVLIMYFAGLSTVMAAFFVCARFRQPLVPAAAILSVYLIFRLAHNWRNLSSRPRFGLGMIVILVVGLNLGDDVGSSTHRSQFHALMGSCHEKARDYSTAADQFERALEISAENVGVYASLGECYMWMRLPDKAKTAFLEGVRRYPEFYRAHFGLARIAHMQRDYEEAKRRYYLTLAYSPNFVPAFEHLGQIYEVQKQPDSALHYYRQFQQFYPSPKTARKIEKLARDNAAPPRQSP